MASVTDIGKLVALVARLRAPDGCPWDRQQNLPDLRAYLIEEAHEVAAAIDAGDLEALDEELGDLLFQVVFVAALAAEAGGSNLDRIIDHIEAKMIARHPHVFGDETLPDAEAVSRAWEGRKRQERDGSLLAGIPPSLPALVAAYRMTQKAAGVGFDWSDAKQVLDKVDEEVGELRRAVESPEPNEAAAAEELGDLLFTLANLARHFGIDPEAAAAAANRKFRRRFEIVERNLDLEHASSAEMEAAWEAAKREE